MRNSRHNNALIPGGEAQLVGWSRSMLYSGFNILPRSVFWSADFNGRSDNTDVIHPELMTRYEACRRCDARILEQTALNNRGLCTPCARRNRKILLDILSIPLFLAELAFAPFQIIGQCVASSIKRSRFPYDFSEIACQITSIYPNDKDARRYRHSVVEGFYSPIFGAMTPDPRHLPYTEGRVDGSKLHRNEIEFNSLPTRDIVFDPDRWMDNKTIERLNN